MARRQPINNKVRNGDFTDAPAFTAATNTINRWIDGSAGGSTTNDTYKWGIFTLSGTVSTQFDDGAMKLSTSAVSSFIEVGPYRLDTAVAHKEKACPVLPSTSYTATFRMKTSVVSGDATNGALMNFIEQNGDGTNVISNSSTAIKTTTDWTTYTVTFTTTANTRFVSPVMRIYGHQGAGTLIMSAWFDDIKLDTTTPSTRTTITTPRVSSRYMGGSTQFNGTTSTIPTTLTDNTDFTSGFVLHGWIYLRSSGEGGGTERGRIFDKSSASSANDGFALAHWGGGSAMLFNVNNGTWRGTGSLPKGWFHLVTHVSSNATVSHYINGVASGTPGATGALSGITTTNPLTIGNRSTATDRTFDGNLAELGTISLAGRGDLSATEITNLYTSSIRPTGAAHFWELDEQPSTYTDSIGGNTGTGTATAYVSDTPVQQRVAVRDMGTALRFGASAGATVVSDSSVMPNFSTTSYTVSACAKAPLVTSNVAADQQIIVGSGLQANPYWYLALRNGNYLLRYQDADEDRQVTTPQRPNQPVHLTAVLDKTLNRTFLYINGLLIGSQTVTSWGNLNSELLTVGFLTGTTSFNGIIDEPRIWNRALTATEIANMYFNNIVPRTGLVAEYLFNEASGSTALDTSGNGNNGTITGATYTTDVPLRPRTSV